MVTAKNDYVRFLNRNYCITSHLAERLDELRGPGLLVGLPALIDTTIASLEIQLDQANDIYEKIGAVNLLKESESLIGFLEYLFSKVREAEGRVSLFSLLDYITVADALLIEGAKLAKLSLTQFPILNLPDYQLYDRQMLKPIKTLLEEIAVPA